MVPEAVGFRFDGVTRTPATGQHTGGERFSLFFYGTGVEVSEPPSGQPHLVPWTAVTRVSLGVALPYPGGGFVTPIEVESVDEVMRFLIPWETPGSVRIAALDEQLARWSGARDHRRAGHPVWAPPPGIPPSGPQSTNGVPPGSEGPATVRPRRTRRRALLVMGIFLLAAGVGLALVLSKATDGRRATTHAAPRLSPDQQLADQLMLTRNDLPHGWTINTSSAGSDSRKAQRAAAAITGTFARCMGISDQQAAIVLGGQASDQTAQTSSPIFVAPSAADHPGFAFELQTAATIVRTHGDEQNDFALFANPQYPQCAGTAVAAELQLGANSASGLTERAGPATVSVLDLPAPAGEQLSGLLMTFTVSDQSTSVPVEVEALTVGSDRIEANLQAFAIGGQIPAGALTGSVAAFEQRVAGEGKSALI
jgi:hypothetical protein